MGFDSHCRSAVTPCSIIKNISVKTSAKKMPMPRFAAKWVSAIPCRLMSQSIQIAPATVAA
jgi:hypothetical protein